MKAAIYNPYMDTLGGGERYTLTFAKVLSDNGYIVDLEWKSTEIKQNLENRFGLDLSAINIVNDIKRGDGYDLCFWVSDGSIPTLHARKNILHFQMPFYNVKGNSLLNKMKMIRINKIVCNSYFTKMIIDKEYSIKSVILYPPVAVDQIKSKHKEDIILYVGRFSELKQNKGQEILIKEFKNLCDSGITNWKLVLAGGTEVGANDFLERLENSVSDYPIEIVKSPSFTELLDLYGKAKIFWSASGFGINEIENPEKVEHFGITVVEAMAAGAVPVVYAAGGHKEIIQDGKNGFLWVKASELISITRELISNSKKMTQLSLESKSSAQTFSNMKFEKEVLSLLK